MVTPKRPRRITLELTNLCNLSCRECPRHHFKMPLGYMDLSLYRRLIRECVAMEVEVVIPFWRGEIFILPFGPEAIFYAHRQGVNKIVVATNGYYSSLHTIPTELLRIIDVLSVSIHDQRSMDGLREIYGHRLFLEKEERPLLHASIIKPGPLPEIVADLDLYCDEVRTYRRHTIGGVWGDARELKMLPGAQPWCSRLDTDMVIAWDGRVSRCCYVWEPEDISVVSQTILMAWHDPILENIRARYPDRICRRCDQWRGKGKTL